MNTVLFLMFFVVSVSAVMSVERKQESAVASHRSRRNVAQFGAVLWYYTRWNPLKFNNYGCFCGFGGKGNPVDNIDRCCQVHDACYGGMKRNCNDGWLTPSAKFLFYSYSCRNGACQCTDTAYRSCRKYTCECDVKFAQCVKDNMNSYNKNHKFIGKSCK